MITRFRSIFYPLILATCLTSCEENGPTIKNPFPFLGCYHFKNNTIRVSQNVLTNVKTGQKTNIERFLVLKNYNAVQVTNNIVIRHIDDSVSMGSSKSGYFYSFDDYHQPLSILIPDDTGEIQRLEKARC